ncbi:DNA double-strand break repair nuclease NurA [bacterium LRH843]|nr:DNA double-strand break repair nuclease NurA [bacterium LRH843]
MFEISPKLVEKVKEINGALLGTYKHTASEKKGIRQKLEAVGAIRHVEPYLPKKLLGWLDGREVAAVDGSVNQTKGDIPHVLYLFQALAKTTTGFKSMASDIYTPLMDETNEEEHGVNWRAKILAKLELEVAYELLEKRDIALLLMDGALYHYRIDAPLEWERLRQKAISQNVFLVGVSEEITTENLIQLDEFQSFRKWPQSYDRDLLFGILKYGEMIHFEQIQHKAGLESAWIRFSSDPAITGFDMLEEQAMAKDEISRLLLTLTPRDGRGIPLWLDYVDREVRVTDKLVEALVEQYIDPEIAERFFKRKRQNRPY